MSATASETRKRLPRTYPLLGRGQLLGLDLVFVHDGVLDVTGGAGDAMKSIAVSSEAEAQSRLRKTSFAKWSSLIDRFVLSYKLSVAVKLDVHYFMQGWMEALDHCTSKQLREQLALRLTQ